MILRLLKRYPLSRVEEPAKSVTISGLAQFQSVFEKIFRPVPTLGESIAFLYILAGQDRPAGTTWGRELITLYGCVRLPFLIPAKFGAKNLE